ncbi:MAG TPA: PilX N-terminal domain-containing pilus assembly protein, partial [Variovorax sp.]|nr:PilX N-terminal domain-containing pilus assembly protein [Variovorax sp.]
MTRPSDPSQRGVSLIVVLLILVVVSVLGVGGAQIALMAERGSRNDRDMQVAWQAAEAALMDAEFDIHGPNTAAASRRAVFDQMHDTTA